MSNRNYSSHIHTIVIGGGQAGLSVGYHLRKLGIPFLILDAHRRIGDAWRNRWDSLRLFTPARYCGLPGLPFPGRGDSFPTKNDVAHYLELYAKHFQLPLETNAKVNLLSKNGNRFVVTVGEQRFESENVVVAMANYQVPKRPAFAAEIDTSIVQLHAHEYRNPAQLPKGDVLIVGAGNSAADIAIEVARTHETWMSGKESGFVPLPIDGILGRQFLSRVIRFIGHHVLTLSTPIGRKKRSILLRRTTPLIRVKPRDLIAAGITRVPKVAGVRYGLPWLEDGRTLNVRSIVWCTGYTPGFSWINLPVLGSDGLPAHELGGVRNAPGLFFVGLHFLYSMTSATLVGVGRDAQRIAQAIASRQAAPVGAAVGLKSVQTA